MPEENLLSHEVMKIVFEDGARFLWPDRREAFDRIRAVLGRALESVGSDLASASTGDFRKLYHKAWTEVLDELAPYEAHRRLTENFRRLVF